MNWYWLCFLLCPLNMLAQVRLSPVFSDNMVLQRDRPLRIWGKAAPGQMVTITFALERKSIRAGKDSAWLLTFKKQKASAAPQSIIIASGEEKKVLANILIGDVWLCSGQSNMEWPMGREQHWRQEKKAAQQPLIRLNNPPPAGRSVYGVAYTDSLNRRLTEDSFYLWRNWAVCDSNTVKDMTAAGYYFAKALVEKAGVPIGLINLSIGGAPIETFISRDALHNSRQFRAKVEGNWLENKSLPEWVRQRGWQNVGGTVIGNNDSLGPNHAYKPGFAFESGVKPLRHFPIKGVLWYQGESNSLEKARVEEYGDLLQLLINNYRKAWKQPALPFYWVQLSSIDTVTYQSRFWPQFRDEQRKLLAVVKNGGMAVSSDLGFRNDVHPTNKKAVGERLARWALQQLYKKPVMPSGPLAKQAKYDNGKVRVYFTYADGLQTADGKALRGFSFDGKTEVDAIIQADTIILLSSAKPAAVYYGWRPFTDANLVNAGGLPASTFKLDVK